MNHGLKITWIWDDADMIEFECSVDTGYFRGQSTCYAARGEMEQFGKELSVFAVSFEGRPKFDAGLADRTKFVKIELYAIDRAKHIAAHVCLATDRGLRPEEVARLEAGFPVEALALDLFVNQLRTVRRVGDEAFLQAAG